jgi:hypothetical protein
MAKLPAYQRKQIKRAQDIANTNTKPDSSTNIKEPLPAVMMARVFRVSQDTTHPKYKLHSSVILDSKATLHIRNNKARFTELTLANDSSFLYAGDNHIRIEAYKTIKVIVQTNSYLKGRKIILTKAAFVLSFYMSIVSLQLLNKHQVY